MSPVKTLGLLAVLLGAGCNCDAGGTPCATGFTLLVPDGGLRGSTATAISRDGTTVVGAAGPSGAAKAFRWREGTGLQLLGALDAGQPRSVATAVSADGEVVVGASASGQVTCAGRTDEAFRWTPATGMQGLGDLDGGCFFSAAYGVSADGNLVVGTATNALANTAATWTAASGWQDLGLSTALDNSSSLAAVTPDRQVMVGTVRLGSSTSYQLLRISAGAASGLGDLDGDPTFAGFNAVADDGRLAVGIGSHSGSGPSAVRWTSDGGVVDLNPGVAGFSSSAASAVTPDGTLAVGSLSTELDDLAFIWPGAAPPGLSLASALQDAGVAVPAGYQLFSATGVAVAGKQVWVVGQAVATTGGGASLGYVARWCLP